MSTKRYIAQPDGTGDYQVFDTKRGVPVASGLNSEEVEEAANVRNKEYDQERSKF